MIVPVRGSDLAALAPVLLPALPIGSILKSVHAPALVNLYTVESAPVIVGTHVSTAPVIPQSTLSTVLCLGSVPTAPKLLRSEAIDRNAMVRAPHRFWGNRRSDLTSVPCVKCFRALCQASRSLWTPLGMMQAIRRPLALPLVGPRRLERSGQRRVCPRHVGMERLAHAPSRLEEREHEERSHRSTRRPDRSSGDRGQSPPRKRRRSCSPSVVSFSGSDNVSLYPSDSLSNEVDSGSEMRAPTLPASVPPGADAGRSGSRPSGDRSPQPGPSCQTQTDAAPRERDAGERRDARSFPSAPGAGEDERAGSTEPPLLEKDAPFRQVLKSIRDYHGFPTPPETTPHPDRSAMARHLGLPLEHAPALHLPASQLTKALIDDVNAHMRKFCEDQTQGVFLSIPGRRSRRFYRTSEPLFPAPYQIPPGVAPLVQESSTDVKRRPTTYSPSLSSSQEVLLSSACETASWIDLALPACSNFSSRLHADSKPEFERMMLSVGRAVEFLASQVVTALGNHVLAKRNSLLRDPQSTVPVEALSRLRHASLPSSSPVIFPTPLLDDVLSKSRASANDELVKKSLHPPRIPKKVPSGQGRPHPRASSVDCGGESPVTPRSQGSSQHQRSSNSGHRGMKSRRGGQGKGNRSNNNKGSGRKGGGKRHS